MDSTNASDERQRHLAKMEEVLRGYYAVVQPAGRDGMVKEIYTEVTGKRYSGEFDPDADYFAYLIIAAVVAACERKSYEL